MKSSVHIIKDNRITPSQFEEVLNVLGLREKLAKSKLVCIKPNLAAGSIHHGDSGVLVQFPLLEAVLKGIRRVNKDAVIMIAEADSTGGGYAYLKFEKQGYHLLVEKYQPLRLVDLSRDRLRTLEMENGRYFEKLPLAESLFQADFIISLAKMKTHNMTTVTGAVKNLFGCLPDSDKSVYHLRLHDVIADVASVIDVSLAIVDGNPGMEGNGPVKGRPLLMNRIILGNSAVATDAVMSYVMGVDPRKVKHLELASRAVGISLELSDITLTGASVEESAVQVQHIGPVQRSIVMEGVRIQKMGAFFYQLGHMIHFQESLKRVLVIIVRAFLLLLFKKQTLKKYKRMLLG